MDNSDLLDEVVTSEDYIGLDDEIGKITDFLKLHTKKVKTIFVAYIGAYGCGKSTVLEAVRSNPDNVKKYMWLRFEPWRYSDRREIWDGFVIEVSAQIRGKSKDKVAGKIDGGSLTVKAEVLIILSLLLIILSILSSYHIWDYAGKNRFQADWLKYALPVLVSGLGFLGLASILDSIGMTFKRGAITRVFQFESLLKKSLRKLKKPLVIVIEEIDRTGKEGQVFLETAKNFFRNNDFGVSIIVIAPQTADNFVPESPDEIDSVFDQNLKIYDLPIYFKNDLSKYDFKKYYETLGLDKSEEDKIVRALNIFSNELNQQVSLRLFKYALREANEFVKSHKGSSLSIAFFLILSRYIKVNLHDGRIYIAASMLKSIYLQRDMQNELAHFLVFLADPDNKWRANVGDIHVDFEPLKNVERKINGSISKKGDEILVILDNKYLDLI